MKILADSLAVHMCTSGPWCTHVRCLTMFIETDGKPSLVAPHRMWVEHDSGHPWIFVTFIIYQCRAVVQWRQAKLTLPLNKHHPWTIECSTLVNSSYINWGSTVLAGHQLHEASSWGIILGSAPEVLFLDHAVDHTWTLMYVLWCLWLVTGGLFTVDP